MIARRCSWMMDSMDDSLKITVHFCILEGDLIVLSIDIIILSIQLYQSSPQNGISWYFLYQIGLIYIHSDWWSSSQDVIQSHWAWLALIQLDFGLLNLIHIHSIINLQSEEMLIISLIFAYVRKVISCLSMSINVYHH